SLKAQVHPLVQCQPDLLHTAPATVVPQQPLSAIVDGIRLVNGVVVPLIFSGANDRVGRMTLPIGGAVPGAGNTDLSVVPVTKTDVEHHMPFALPHDLAGRHTVPFPGSLWVRLEDGVVLMLGPVRSIGAGGVADGVRLVLFPPGVPHAVELVLV